MGQHVTDCLAPDAIPCELHGLRIPFTQYALLRVPASRLVASDAHITITSDGLFPTANGASCAVLPPILKRIPVQAYVVLHAHTSILGLRWRLRLQCTLVMGLRTFTKALSQP